MVWGVQGLGVYAVWVGIYGLMILRALNPKPVRLCFCGFRMVCLIIESWGSRVFSGSRLACCCLAPGFRALGPYASVPFQGNLQTLQPQTCKMLSLKPETLNLPGA